MPKLICPKCGGTRFFGHQVCRIDILVNEDNEFAGNLSGGAEANIYDSETPYGPYTCIKCNYEFDV